jgi:hypothetical protein
MGKPSKAVLDFMSAYKIDSDEIWEVHGSTWVVKHKALERVAVETGIVWLRPSVQVCDLANKIAVICAFGKLGEREEWSFGEASPANNKNSYPMAMAEKRARDRVILKLLVTHGALYSEAEADEFAQPRQNPHVNRAADFHEEFTSDIPDVPATKMKVKDARPLYDVMVKEMRRVTDPTELREWGEARAGEINALPGDWPQHFRAAYRDHQKSIMNGATA